MVKKYNLFLQINETNLGVAKGLNQILDKSYEINSNYLLTLDQDSSISKQSILEMMKYINNDNIAIVCPLIVEKNKYYKIKQKSEIMELNRCITSGSLMNLKICKKIGYFDEKMFIDYVDFDYCKRIILNNKKIVRIKKATIKHEIGKRTKRRFIFFTVYPTNHNKTRVYYYVRNIKYYLRKFKYKLSIKEIIYEYINLLWKFTSIILYEQDKSGKIKMFFNGWKDSKFI